MIKLNKLRIKVKKLMEMKHLTKQEIGVLEETAGLIDEIFYNFENKNEYASDVLMALLKERNEIDNFLSKLETKPKLYLI